MGFTWEKIAMLARMNYGVQVDWDEGFFVCPNCGEPIYDCDWDACDLMDGNGNFICPVCEDIIE